MRMIQSKHPGVPYIIQEKIENQGRTSITCRCHYNVKKEISETTWRIKNWESVHLFMSSWTKVRSCGGYEVYRFQSSNFASQFIFRKRISGLIDFIISIFFRDVCLNLLFVKFGNSIPCHQATKWMTNKRYFLKVSMSLNYR